MNDKHARTASGVRSCTRLLLHTSELHSERYDIHTHRRLTSAVVSLSLRRVPFRAQWLFESALRYAEAMYFGFGLDPYNVASHEAIMFKMKTYGKGTWNDVYRIAVSSLLALGMPRGMTGDQTTVSPVRGGSQRQISPAYRGKLCVKIRNPKHDEQWQGCSRSQMVAVVQIPRGASRSRDSNATRHSALTLIT